jgi:NTP pyrophosphatase (non-canonical NTP hydrolase)
MYDGAAQHAVSENYERDALTRVEYAVRDLCGIVHGRCVTAGWYSDLATGEPIERNVPEMLALIHSEVSEGLEGYRKNKMDDHLPDRPMLEVEMADVIIRIADMCGYLGLDLGGAILAKMAYNANRADHKIENRRKPGGKAI